MGLAPIVRSVLVERVVAGWILILPERWVVGRREWLIVAEVIELAGELASHARVRVCGGWGIGMRGEVLRRERHLELVGHAQVGVGRCLGAG